MRNFLFTFLSLVSLLAFLATAIPCSISFFQAHELRIQHVHSEKWFTLSRATLILQFATSPARQSPWAVQHFQMRPFKINTLTFPSTISDQSIAGVRIMRLNGAVRGVAVPANISGTVIVLPLWPVLLLTLPLPLLWLWRKRAERIRLRIGHCPICGYDLRASPERCPECGSTTAKPVG